MLWTSVPLAVALVLCFTAPQLGDTGKIIWAAATFNLLMVIYAANNIPYCALSGVMTFDSSERTSLASWRFLCAMAATLIVNMVTVDLVTLFGRGDTAFGYQCTMGLWGAVVVVLLAISFGFTAERVSASPKQRSTLRQDLSDLIRNRPWFALFALAMLIHVQLAFRAGSMLYYFSHYLQREDLFGWFSGIGLAFTMVGVFLSKPLAERFGKRNTFQVCLLLSSLLMAMFALVPPDSLGALFALQILMQLVFGPTIPMLWAMMADVADYSEWKTGRRSTALAFASIVFGLKVGFGVGAWLNGSLLDYFGYTATAGQSVSAIRGIVLMISAFPAAALFVGFLVLFFYRIDGPLERQIEQTLRARRAGDPALGTQSTDGAAHEG